MFKAEDVVRCTYDWLEGIYGKNGIVIGYEEDSILGDDAFVIVYYPDLEDGQIVVDSMRLSDYDGKYNEKKYFGVLSQDLELVKGDDNMLKVNDKVVVLGVAGVAHALKVGTEATVISIITDNIIKVKGVSASNPDKEVVQILNIKQVELKGDDSMNKLVGKEMVALVDSLKGVYEAGDVGVIVKFREDEDGAIMGLQFDHKKDGLTTWVKPENFKPTDVEFDIDDVVVALFDSDKGVYSAGDIGSVCGFRLDVDGAVMGVKFDHKKSSTTTWVKPENFGYPMVSSHSGVVLDIGQDVVMVADSAKGVYSRLDVGTITKFRDDKDGATVGVQFKHKRASVTTWVKPENLMIVPKPVAVYAPYGKIKVFNLTSLLSHGWDMIGGVLCLRGSDYKLSGIMKNIIDKEFDALDMGYDNILIELDGVEYVINKALRGTLFKTVK